MRNILKRYLPDPEALRAHRWLGLFGNTLLHPRLWHLNRHSAAGGVAIGLFCGLVPGPLQMLSAAICCVIFRMNLPVALVCTLYTNPFTIVPLYLLAYALGSWILGGNGAPMTPPPEFSGLSFLPWVEAFTAWFAGLGRPLLLGLILLASGLAVLGYGAVKALWRWQLVRRWRQRGLQRHRRP